MISGLNVGNSNESLQALCGIVLTTANKDDLASELLNLDDNFEVI